MPYYLLLSRSITHAQRMSRTLERAGITARFFRPPMGLTDRGCSYAVRVGDRYLPAALDCLRAEAHQRQILLFSCHSREAGWATAHSVPVIQL